MFKTVFTLASGFDVEKYVEKFVNKDFIISTADYFNFKFGNSDSKNDLSTSFIEAVEMMKSLFTNFSTYFSTSKPLASVNTVLNNTKLKVIEIITKIVRFLLQ